MDLKRYTVATDGSVTAKTETAGAMDIAVDGITNLFKGFSSSAEKDLITVRESGLQSLGVGVLAFLGGNYHGYSQARKGKGPILSFLA